MPDKIEASPLPFNDIPFRIVYVWVTADGIPWASLALAEAWAKDEGAKDEGTRYKDGTSHKERIAFLDTLTKPYRVWLQPASNMAETFYELGTEYTPKDTLEVRRASALQKLTLDDRQALGLTGLGAQPLLV